MIFRILLPAALALTAALFAALPARAEDETPFATIDTTSTTPMGESEIEQRVGWKHGRTGQSYDAFEGATEYEYGLTQRLQLGLYLKYGWARVRPHSGSHVSEGATFNGVAAEAIYNVWDEETHAVGLSLYFEASGGPDKNELEWKLLLQKNLLDDRLVLATNLVLENEWERAGPHWERHTEFNILAGASYRVAPEWWAGVEFASQREYDGLLPWQTSNAAANSYFIGPTLHYGNDDFFVTLGAQAQLPWAQNLSGTPGETVNGFASEEERYRVQLRFGMEI